MRVCLFFLLLLFSALLHAECFQVSVEVQITDQDGKAWDRGIGKFRKPDLVLCIHDSLGLRCILDASEPENHKAYCEDNYVCEFPSTPFPDKRFTLEIKDMDIRNDNRVGIAKCVRGEKCLVGLATVRFAEAACPSYEILHNNKLEPTADAPAD